MDDPKELGVHLLRRAGPDEDLIGEVASVMEYQDASEQAAGSWKRLARPDHGEIRRLVNQDEAVAEAQRRVVRRGEPGEGQRGEHEPEVAQRDVVEAREREQADHDRAQPRGDDVAAVARLVDQSVGVVPARADS